jgi:hypothetical protein
MGRQNASDLRPIYHPIAGIADVCLWHKADIQLSASNVRFWVNSGHQRPSIRCLLFDPKRTLYGHTTYNDHALAGPCRVTGDNRTWF